MCGGRIACKWEKISYNPTCFYVFKENMSVIIDKPITKTIRANKPFDVTQLFSKKKEKLNQLRVVIFPMYTKTIKKTTTSHVTTKTEKEIESKMKQFIWWLPASFDIKKEKENYLWAKYSIL